MAYNYEMIFLRHSTKGNTIPLCVTLLISTCWILFWQANHNHTTGFMLNFWWVCSVLCTLVNSVAGICFVTCCKRCFVFRFPLQLIECQIVANCVLPLFCLCPLSVCSMIAIILTCVRIHGNMWKWHSCVLFSSSTQLWIDHALHCLKHCHPNHHRCFMPHCCPRGAAASLSTVPQYDATHYPGTIAATMNNRDGPLDVEVDWDPWNDVVHLHQLCCRRLHSTVSSPRMDRRWRAPLSCPLLLPPQSSPRPSPLLCLFLFHHCCPRHCRVAPRLLHLLLAIIANFFRLIVEWTLAVPSHKVAGQLPCWHQWQWKLQTWGDCNGEIGGLVRFILQGDCCISLLSNHNNGATLNNVQLTPVLFSDWHTGPKFDGLQSEENVISC